MNRLARAIAVVLALGVTFGASTAPPTELDSLSAILANPQRSGGERRTALLRAKSIRRDLLRTATGAERVSLALDQAEALVLVGPSLDASDAFVLAGLLDAGDSASLSGALDEARALLAGLPDLAPADAPRRAILTAVYAARRIDLAAMRGERLDMVAPLDETVVARLASPARETARLALARIALRGRPEDAARIIKLVIATSDAPPLLRMAARALSAIGAAERGDADAMTAAQRLVDESANADTPSRLLVADALARAAAALNRPPDAAVEAWASLLATASKIDAAALRAAIVQRVRSTVPTPSPNNTTVTPPLVLAAFAGNLATSEPAATAAALAHAALALAPTDPLLALVRYELARSRALAGEFAAAAEGFYELASDSPGDPLGADAIDLAIEISAELAASANADDADRERASRAISTGLAQFFDHSARPRWLCHKGQLALAADRLGEARAAFGQVPNDPSARLGEALAWIANAAATHDPDDRAKALAAVEASLERAGDVHEGRRDLIEAWRLLVRQDAAAAAEQFSRALSDVHLDAHDVSLALGLLLRTQLAADRPAVLTPAAHAAVERVPAAARPPLVDYVRESVDVLEREKAASVPELAAQRLGELLPLPIEIVAIATVDERVLLARALLLSGHADEAYRLTGSLLAEAPTDLERMLLHARSAEFGHRAEALTLYRATISSAAELSSPWWRGQLGELRLLEPDPKASASDARDLADLILARINRLRQRDAKLGGDVTRVPLESLADRVRATSSVGH